MKDIDEFKELIEINDINSDLNKRYKLCEEISGKKIKNRIENLIVACWSSKDWIKKEIESNIDTGASRIFENNLFNYDNTHLIQYLADSIKHGGIDSRFLRTNKFKISEPRLGQTFLKLVNNSVQGNLKPTYMSEGDNVPPFEISSVILVENGNVYYNFDTIELSVIINDKDGKNIGHAMQLVDNFVTLLKTEYNKFMRI